MKHVNGCMCICRVAIQSPDQTNLQKRKGACRLQDLGAGKQNTLSAPDIIADWPELATPHRVHETEGREREKRRGKAREAEWTGGERRRKKNDVAVER